MIQAILFINLKCWKSPRWIAERDKAAILAKAILSSVVTDKLSTLKEFYSPNATGPGAALSDWRQLTHSGREEESHAQYEETSEYKWCLEIKEAKSWNWKT